MQPSLELGVVGNCSCAALVDEYGRICFACFPRFDSDPMFNTLLTEGDAEHGFWDLVLEGMRYTTQEYQRNTAILRTVLTSEAGDAVEILDFAPRFSNFGRSFHPVQLFRRIRPIKGLPRITVRCRPSRDYGAQRCPPLRGSSHIRFTGTDFEARLTTDAPVSFIVEEVPFVLQEEYCFVWGTDEALTRAPRDVLLEFAEKTAHYWSEFTRSLHVPFQWQSAVIRAAITLKLCSFEESGAIVAALTTSIPESANSGRNWDYRFCWLRDAFHTVRALNYLGATTTMEHYLGFITNIVAATKHGDLQPLYGILMETTINERCIDHLGGYRGMGPVRVGNAAYTQRQNDNYGSVILAVCNVFFDERLSEPGNEQLYAQLEHLGTLATQAYNQPDAGLWELRGSMRVHTFSAVMCWAACDRLAKIAVQLHKPAAKWVDCAARIKADVLQRAWDASANTFIAVMDGPGDVDACLLLLAELGFINASDPRFVATVDAVGHRLMKNGFLYRYVQEDDFGRPEAAFTICTFWYVNALAMIGRRDEAVSIFERLLACRNSLGLFSEDLDTSTRELWGNFPQTYSMVGLINCAIRLSVDWTDAGLC